MHSFFHKVVVISGAANGIGLATARAFGRAGARVHLVDIDAQGLQRAVPGIPGATAHQVDCTDGQAMEQLAARIYRLRGRVDVLQNGVGMLVAGPVEQLSEKQWQRAVELNLWSVIHGVRVFVPRMLAQDPGPGRAHLVNVASFAGLVGFPYTAPYSTCKFAVVGLSEVLSAELAGRLHVTAVCPGAVNTNLANDAAEQGLLQLPGEWNGPFLRAFEQHSVSPELVAQQILRGVRRRQRVVVPSLWLAQLWRLKRLSGRLFGAASDGLFAQLQKLVDR